MGEVGVWEAAEGELVFEIPVGGVVDLQESVRRRGDVARLGVRGADSQQEKQKDGPKQGFQRIRAK